MWVTRRVASLGCKLGWLGLCVAVGQAIGGGQVRAGSEPTKADAVAHGLRDLQPGMDAERPARPRRRRARAGLQRFFLHRLPQLGRQWRRGALEQEHRHSERITQPSSHSGAGTRSPQLSSRSWASMPGSGPAGPSSCTSSALIPTMTRGEARRSVRP